MGKENNQDHPGKAELRTALRDLRWDKQDGYPGYCGDGKWDFTAICVPLTPEALNYLMALVGIIPDQIVPIGSCDTCKFSKPDGSNRGWDPPCVSCEMPIMSNFVAKLRVAK